MDIPKAKVLIYLLTFAGYAYSGYGHDMLHNLRDAVVAAEHVFGDVFGNAIKVASKFLDVHEVLDAAVEENCIFTCPGTVMKPLPNKHHKPSSNGCGSHGLEIPGKHLPITGMTKCCDEHDFCYDTCNSEKEKCDFIFKRCLYKLCDQVDKSVGETTISACKAGAKLLFTGTQSLGCKAYLDAQKSACFCPTITKKKYQSNEL